MKSDIFTPIKHSKSDISKWIIVPWFLFSEKDFIQLSSYEVINIFSPFKTIIVNGVGIYLFSGEGTSSILKVMNELYQLGGREFYYIGSCGALNGDIDTDKIQIPQRGYLNEMVSLSLLTEKWQELSLLNGRKIYDESVNIYLKELYEADESMKNSCSISSVQDVYGSDEKIIADLRSSGVDIIDMETTLFFTFLYLKELKGRSYQFVSDVYDDSGHRLVKINKGRVLKLIKDLSKT